METRCRSTLLDNGRENEKAMGMIREELGGRK